MNQEVLPDSLEAVRQEHEGFLSELEGLAVHAIASGDWSQVRDLINDFKDYQQNDDCLSAEHGDESKAPTDHRPTEK